MSERWEGIIQPTIFYECPDVYLPDAPRMTEFGAGLES